MSRAGAGRARRAVVYSCSGSSNVAQLANAIAVRLDRRGLADMSCIAGVGGDVPSLVRAAVSAETVIAIDGCPLACCERVLAARGVRPARLVRLHELGLRKARRVDVPADDAERVYRVVLRDLAPLLAEASPDLEPVLARELSHPSVHDEGGRTGMTTVNPERTVAELVAERPGRARVFEQLQVDYCCGGRRSLADACAEKELDVGAVAAMLEAAEDGAGGEDVDWRSQPLAALCDHIVGTHHAYLRDELPRLAALVEKVARVHGGRHPELEETHGLFEVLAEELDHHMQVEERVLFPACRELEAGGQPATGLAQPIRAMEHDHDLTGDALARVRELTGGYRPPVDACTSYRAMLDGLESLERDLHRHIHEENNVLFPRALALERQPAA